MNKKNISYVLIVLLSIFVISSGCITKPSQPEPTIEFAIGTWTGIETDSKITFFENQTYAGIFSCRSPNGRLFPNTLVSLNGTWNIDNDGKYILWNENGTEKMGTAIIDKKDLHIETIYIPTNGGGIKPEIRENFERTK